MLIYEIGLNNASSPFGITYEVPIIILYRPGFFVIPWSFFMRLKIKMIYIVGNISNYSYITTNKKQLKMKDYNISRK